MTYDEFKVVVAKVIEIEYDHWLKHGTPIRKEDAVLVADDVAGEVFIDSAVELARLRAEIDRLRGLLAEWRRFGMTNVRGKYIHSPPVDLVDRTDAAIGTKSPQDDGTAVQPSAAPRLTPEERALLNACEARFRRVMSDFHYERVEDVTDDAVSLNPEAQALLSATREWMLKRAADNGAAPPDAQPSPARADALGEIRARDRESGALWFTASYCTSRTHEE